MRNFKKEKKTYNQSTNNITVWKLPNEHKKKCAKIHPTGKLNIYITI